MVWNPNDADKKILKFLYENREGLRAKTIMNLSNFKQSHLYKRLNILKGHNIVESDFPVWKILNGQVQFCRTLLKDSKIFELHNVGYVVKLIRVPPWWNPEGTQMRSRLMRIKKYQFKRINWGKNNSNPYVQLKSDKYVIQMYPESVIVIHRKRYYSNNPHDTAIQFLQDFYDLWEWFEERMKFKFFLDGVPQMAMRGSDFNRLNDFIANKVRKEKSRFLVEIGDGRKVWVDRSEPYGKEANTPEMQEIMERVTKDRVLNPTSLLPSELTSLASQNARNAQSLIGTVSGIAENQVTFDRNIHKHQKVLDEMSLTLKEIRDNLNKLNKNSG